MAAVDDERVSAPGDRLSAEDLAAAEAARETARDAAPPRGLPAPAFDAAEAAGWLAQIALGRTRADVGIADGTRAAELFDRLAADVAAIRARGDEVDVPPEWFG